MSDKDGGPAFARPAGDYNGTKNGNGAHRGMSLRDYFAAKALTSMVQPIEFQRFDLTVGMAREACENFATRAYQIADAMLRARGQS